MTAAWLLPDEESPAARRVYARMRRGTLDLQAPDLWLWECGNIIANGVRRGRIAPPDALLTWSVLDAIRTRVELTSPVPSQARAALVLALDNGLSMYDAAYLWLALSLPAAAPDQRPCPRRRRRAQRRRGRHLRGRGVTTPTPTAPAGRQAAMSFIMVTV